MRRVVAAFVVFALAGACRPGKVTESQPMTERLSTWSSMSIELVTGQRDADLDELEVTLQRRAREEQVLPYADPHSAGLRVRVIVREWAAGGVTEKARIHVEVELLDTKRNTVVGRFDVRHKNEAQIDLEPMSRSERMRQAVEHRIFAWLRAHRD